MRKSYFLWCFILLNIHMASAQPETLEQWKNGNLDIYHINTGRGNATFFIFPDGTTMLFDAGELNAGAFEKWSSPLKVTDAYPNDSLRAGQWITNFISKVHPTGANSKLDYALISHYHSDHYGSADNQSPLSRSKAYRLSGITQVGENLPITMLIDRGSSFPLNLKEYYSSDFNFQNYLAFKADQATTNRMHSCELIVGVNTQIRLLHQPLKYPEFSVRNIKSNNQVWSGNGLTSHKQFTVKEFTNEKGQFSENPLSLAIKVSYGEFDYYTGGDNTGLSGDGIPKFMNVEAAIAKATGKVEVMALNHHGNRDASSEEFLKKLAAKVIIQQGWCSDQPGQEVMYRINDERISPNTKYLYGLNITQQSKVFLGPWLNKYLKSSLGHVLVRVEPGGVSYRVYVLEGKNLSVISQSGMIDGY